MQHRSCYSGKPSGLSHIWRITCGPSCCGREAPGNRCGCVILADFQLLLLLLPLNICCLGCALCAGWFSLNVPSGLTLYWFVNNIISTAQQVYMKKTIKVELPGLAAAGVGGAGPIIDTTATTVRPKEERVKKVRRLRWV